MSPIKQNLLKNQGMEKEANYLPSKHPFSFTRFPLETPPLAKMLATQKGHERIQERWRRS